MFVCVFRTVERLPRVSRGLVDIECRENDNVSFECKLNITQETDIRWQKDGKVCTFTKQPYVHYAFGVIQYLIFYVVMSVYILK